MACQKRYHQEPDCLPSTIATLNESGAVGEAIAMRTDTAWNTVDGRRVFESWSKSRPSVDRGMGGGGGGGKIAARISDTGVGAT